MRKYFTSWKYEKLTESEDFEDQRQHKLWSVNTVHCGIARHCQLTFPWLHSPIKKVVEDTEHSYSSSTDRDKFHCIREKWFTLMSINDVGNKECCVHIYGGIKNVFLHNLNVHLSVLLWYQRWVCGLDQKERPCICRDRYINNCALILCWCNRCCNLSIVYLTTLWHHSALHCLQ